MIKRSRVNQNTKRTIRELQKLGYERPRLKKVEKEAIEQGLSPTRIARARVEAKAYNKTQRKLKKQRGIKLDRVQPTAFYHKKPKIDQHHQRLRDTDETKRRKKREYMRKYRARKKAEAEQAKQGRREVTELPLTGWYQLPKTVRTGIWNNSENGKAAFNYVNSGAGIWDGPAADGIDPNIIWQYGQTDDFGNTPLQWLKIVFPEYNYETDDDGKIHIYERS